jgi:hypothetical protein
LPNYCRGIGSNQICERPPDRLICNRRGTRRGLTHIETAEHLIKRLDTNRLVDLLGPLLRDNFPARVSEIEKLIEDIKTARAERNEILHWIWGKADDPATATMASLRIHREKQFKTKTANELYALADRLLATANALSQFDPWARENLGSD